MRTVLAFFLLLLLICASSCTMQRRHYRPGFYVDWNAQRETSSQEKNAGKALREEKNDVPGKAIVKAASQEEKAIPAAQPQTRKENPRAQKTKTSPQPAAQKKAIASPAKRKTPEKKNDEPKGELPPHPAINASITLSVLGVLGILLTGVIPANFLISVFVLLAVMLISAIILAAVGIERLRLTSGVYSGKNLGIASIVISIFGLVLLVGAIILSVLLAI